MPCASSNREQVWGQNFLLWLEGKIRCGSNCSNFSGTSVACFWQQSHHLISTESKQYICDFHSLPGSGLVLAIWLRKEEIWWDLFVVQPSVCIRYLFRNGLWDLTSQALKVMQKRSYTFSSHFFIGWLEQFCEELAIFSQLISANSFNFFLREAI